MLFSPAVLFRPYPSAPVTGMTAWYRADTCNLSGSNVTQLTDKSGNGLHLVTGTSPTQNASDVNFNGQASISFNGSSQVLKETTGAALSSFVDANDGTMFAVFRAAAYGAGNDGNNSAIIWADSQSNGRYWVFGVGSSQAVFSPSGPSVYTNAGVAMNLNQTYGAEMRFDPTGIAGADAIYLRLSGNTEVQVADTDALGNTTNTTAMGANYQGGTRFFNGKLAELIIYKGVMSSANRQANRDYLQGRYGISW